MVIGTRSKLCDDNDNGFASRNFYSEQHQRNTSNQECSREPYIVCIMIVFHVTARFIPLSK